MSQSANVIKCSPSNARAYGNTVLSVTEQDHLIRAIESAIDVNHQSAFHAWLRGPFCDLLPHEGLACVALLAGGDVHIVNGLQYGLPDSSDMNALCAPGTGLVNLLAQHYRSDRRQSCKVAPGVLDAMRAANGMGSGHRPQPIENVVIHRVTMLSGASYAFFLVNVPSTQIDRCRQLFKLVASHLKMALSRTMDKPKRGIAASLTLREAEILQWMRNGKTNREISALLGISSITLKNHVSKLYRKLDVQNRAEAVSRGGVSIEVFRGSGQ